MKVVIFGGLLAVAVHGVQDGVTGARQTNALTGVAATAGLPTIAHVAVLAPETATPRPHTDLLIFGVSAAGDE